MSTIETWTEQLGRSPVFGALSAGARGTLAATGTMVSRPHGTRLFSAGDAGDAAYLLLSGELEIGLSRADGGETWLARLQPGAIIGDMAVLDRGSRSADVTATRTSVLLRLGGEAVRAALVAEPEAALGLLTQLAQRLRSTNGLLETSAADTGVRLARLLLAGGRRETRSQSDLARIIGTTRESVNRRLSTWRAAGWVGIGSRGVEICDAEALRREAQLAD